MDINNSNMAIYDIIYMRSNVMVSTIILIS